MNEYHLTTYPKHGKKNPEALKPSFSQLRTPSRKPLPTNPPDREYLQINHHTQVWIPINKPTRLCGPMQKSRYCSSSLWWSRGFHQLLIASIPFCTLTWLICRFNMFLCLCCRCRGFGIRRFILLRVWMLVGFFGRNWGSRWWFSRGVGCEEWWWLISRMDAVVRMQSNSDGL